MTFFVAVAQGADFGKMGVCDGSELGLKQIARMIDAWEKLI